MNRSDQSMFKKKINLRQMMDAVLLGARIGKTTFFYGGAGLGKSEKMRQIAEILFPGVEKPLCDVRLSDKEPTDIAGCQIPIEKADGTVRTVYATPEFWPTEPCLVFLDELPNAGLSTQHSAYQVVLDHMAGTFAFPKGCVFVGAGNRDTDNAGTTEMPGPLVNRMMIYEVEYDLDVWIEDYAIPYRLEPNIIGFLKQSPDYFYTGDVTDRESQVYSSPRQWKSVSDVIKDFRAHPNADPYMMEVAIQGLVGDGVDSLVTAYHLRAEKLPPLEDIFNGKIKTHKLLSSDVDLIYVLSQSAMNKIEDDVMDDRKFSDLEVAQRVANFLEFMDSNYSALSRDTVMAMCFSLFKAAPGKEVILTKNRKRQKMLPLLRKNSEAVMKMVMEFQTRYGQLVEDLG